MFAYYSYRPPSAHGVLDTLFSTLCSLNVSVFSNDFLIGDFNRDVSNYSHPLFSKLFSVTNRVSLYQVVRGFTHYNQSGNHSIIDLAFVSSPLLLTYCNTIPPLSTSDHHGFSLSFIQVLYQRDPPSALAKVYGTMLMLILNVLVNFWTKLMGTLYMC